ASYAGCPTRSLLLLRLFSFTDTATTYTYTLSLHDALPILSRLGPSGSIAEASRGTASGRLFRSDPRFGAAAPPLGVNFVQGGFRSEEHTSELQSLAYLVCRLLLEKKKNRITAQLKSGNILR